MKKNILGLILLLLIVAFTSISYANFIAYEAPTFNIEIQNIEDGIKSIWLCIYNKNDIKIEDVFKDSNIEFPDRKVR